MKNDTARMQIIPLDPNSSEAEMISLGIEEKEIKNFLRQKIVSTVRLHCIPLAVKPLLEKAVLLHAAEIFFISGRKDPKGCFDALIAGTKRELTAVGAQLQLLSSSAAELGCLLHKTLDRIHTKTAQGLTLGEYSLPLGTRTLIMGILNVTPDSFSDGGRFDRLGSAIEQAWRMVEEGADIIDIGGESTRPGSNPVKPEEELARIMPVIERLKQQEDFKTPLSVDTYKAEVAEQALSAGVEMLNDVWGLKADKKLGSVAAKHNVPICIMHNRQNTDYSDLMLDILAELEDSIQLARAAGIKDEQIIIDPGIGFGKDYRQSLDVMCNLALFRILGYPILLGTSRKSIIGKTLDLPADERVEGTAATVAYGISAGADIVRVHDVKQMRRVAVMTDAMIRR